MQRDCAPEHARGLMPHVAQACAGPSGGRPVTAAWRVRARGMGWLSWLAALGARRGRPAPLPDVAYHRGILGSEIATIVVSTALATSRILAVVRASLTKSALAKLKRESRGLFRPKRLTGGVVRDRVSGAQADALQGRSRPPRPLLRSRPSLSRRHRPRLRRGRQSRSPPLRWRPAP